MGQIGLRQETYGFPDADSVAALRSRGILTVVVVRSRAYGTRWAGAADRPVTGLDIRRIDLGDAVVFDVRASAASGRGSGGSGGSGGPGGPGGQR